MAKVTQKPSETTPPQDLRVRPKPAAPEKGKVTKAPEQAPAKPGFEKGTPGLGGKFAFRPTVKARGFSAPKGVGLNRETNVLGSPKSVGQVIEQFAEHFDNPDNPTSDHDSALLNLPFEGIA